MGSIEKISGKTVRLVLKIANFFRKSFINNECDVHTYINSQALNILKNDKHHAAHDFFTKHLIYCILIRISN